MDAAGVAHIILASASLVLGVSIFVEPKGTDMHRGVGAAYVLCMFGLNVTALTIYRISGSFGTFHVLSLINVTLLLAGFFTILLKRPRKLWLRNHYYLMGWSYVGLWAAATTEVTVRLVSWPFWAAVVVPTIAIVVLGGALVQLRAGTTLAGIRKRKV